MIIVGCCQNAFPLFASEISIHTILLYNRVSYEPKSTAGLNSIIHTPQIHTPQIPATSKNHILQV